MAFEDVGGTHKLYVNGVQFNLKGHRGKCQTAKV